MNCGVNTSKHSCTAARKRNVVSSGTTESTKTISVGVITVSVSDTTDVDKRREYMLVLDAASDAVFLTHVKCDLGLPVTWGDPVSVEVIDDLIKTHTCWCGLAQDSLDLSQPEL